MAKKKSGQFTDTDVALAYKVVVEQVIVELLQIAEVDGNTEQETLDNLASKGGHIQRHVVEPWKELISLSMNDEITHVGSIWLEDDNIKHFIFTAEEISKGVNTNGN